MVIDELTKELREQLKALEAKLGSLYKPLTTHSKIRTTPNNMDSLVIEMSLSGQYHMLGVAFTMSIRDVMNSEMDMSTIINAYIKNLENSFHNGVIAEGVKSLYERKEPWKIQ